MLRAFYDVVCKVVPRCDVTVKLAKADTGCKQLGEGFVHDGLVQKALLHSLRNMAVGVSAVKVYAVVKGGSGSLDNVFAVAMATIGIEVTDGQQSDTTMPLKPHSPRRIVLTR